jgi:hypothetical protein
VLNRRLDTSSTLLRRLWRCCRPVLPLSLETDHATLGLLPCAGLPLALAAAVSLGARAEARTARGLRYTRGPDAEGDEGGEVKLPALLSAATGLSMLTSEPGARPAPTAVPGTKPCSAAARLKIPAATGLALLGNTVTVLCTLPGDIQLDPDDVGDDAAAAAAVPCAGLSKCWPCCGARGVLWRLPPGLPLRVCAAGVSDACGEPSSGVEALFTEGLVLARMPAKLISGPMCDPAAALNPKAYELAGLCEGSACGSGVDVNAMPVEGDAVCDVLRSTCTVLGMTKEFADVGTTGAASVVLGLSVVRMGAADPGLATVFGQS